jgi:hypothetical protein
VWLDQEYQSRKSIWGYFVASDPTKMRLSQFSMRTFEKTDRGEELTEHKTANDLLADIGKLKRRAKR